MSVARLQQTLALVIVAACAGWALLCYTHGSARYALLLPAILATLFLAVMGLEFALLRRFGFVPPATAPSMRELTAAWWVESLTAIRVFGWQQPFRHRLWPDHIPPAAPARTGVVLIHGYMCNRGIWNRWAEQLTAAGTPWIAVNLQPVFASISDYQQDIEGAVQRLHALTGRPPLLVAHSMGGLAARHYLATRTTTPASPPLNLLTLGTPHQGTWMARFAHSHNAREMRTASRWLLALQQREQAEQLSRIICMHSHCDNIVFPGLNATLPGARAIALRGVGHVAMVDSPETYAEMCRLLKEADAGA